MKQKYAAIIKYVWWFLGQVTWTQIDHKVSLFKLDVRLLNSPRARDFIQKVRQDILIIENAYGVLQQVTLELLNYMSTDNSNQGWPFETVSTSGGFPFQDFIMVYYSV